MKIAMVAPLFESCPPKLYGGTERVVATLCDGLVDEGHEVVLFASGDSDTKAELVPITPEALRLAKGEFQDIRPNLTLQLTMVFERAKEFDVIHNHIGYAPFPFLSHSPCPWVSTLHGRLDLPDSSKIFAYFKKTPLVSISFNQREPLNGNNWLANIYHGIKLEEFKAVEKPGKYLAFLGRICRDKGIETAIEVSQKSGVPLKIAAKVDPVDKEYYETVIKPQIDGQHIEYVGEITQKEKSDFLGNALALISPINWPEPFGLVIIEAYACGTPVIVKPLGSFPEIVEQGETGFLYDETDQLVDAVKLVKGLDRSYIRQYAEENFSIQRMAKQYVEVYQQLVGQKQSIIQKLLRPLKNITPPLRKNVKP